ncbi:phage tail tape measure protein [Tautonia rosea]|uniref:phage tail tape measure protein n=1 Tax=Tautonia rosea TaxID=2728037 RepID=UPI0014745D4A|nr:phage tail tape measure protein [Tautonia rosea]
MLQAQIAALYGEIEMRFAKWDAGVRKIERDVQRLGRMPLTVRVVLDASQFQRQMATLQAQVRAFAATPLPIGQFQALNNQMAQMSAHARAMQAAMAGMRAPNMPGGGFGGYRGRYGGGFASGAMMAAGLPFFGDPRMMAGAATVGGAFFSAREAMRTESAVARLGGIASIDQRASGRMVGRLGGIATDTPGLNRAQSFELAEVLARAGVGASDIPESTRVLGRLAAMTPDAEPRALAEQTVQTLNAYRRPMSDAGGFTAALAALDASAVATAPEILNITRRLAGAGQAARLKLTETMALGAEMRSVGLPVESGSTAMSRILSKMADRGQQAELDRALGLRPGTIGRQYASDPLSALETLFGGIGSATARGDVNALDYIRNELGFTNQRDIMLAGQLGGRMGNVRAASEMADREWGTGSIMADRFKREADTTAAALEKLTDSVRGLASAAGGGANQLVKGAANWGADYFGFFADALTTQATNLPNQQPPGPPPLAMQEGQRSFVGPLRPTEAQLQAMAAQRSGDRFLNDAWTPLNALSGFNVNNALASVAGRFSRGVNAAESALSRVNGAAVRPLDIPERQFAASVMDPMAAMQQQQVDILDQEAIRLQQQQLAAVERSVEILGEIRDAVGNRGGGGGVVPALIGAGFGG